ncbi:MAG: glycine cleavage system protein H, partial [Methylomonas sp.]
ESVKSASDLVSPVTGTVVAVNEEMEDAPELVNEDAYKTWLFAIKADNPAELDQLMNADAYQKMIAE